MTNSEQTRVIPENYEWLAEIFSHEPKFLEEACKLGDQAISAPRAIARAVRAVPHDIASIPLNRGLEAGRIAREISESLDLGTRLGPTALHGAQALLNRDGLSSEHLALADAVLKILRFAGGPAQFEGTTIRQVVRHQTQAWRDQGWTPRTITRGSRAAGVISRPRDRGARPTRARALARSSSRSGDSGDDGPGEPPGDLAAATRLCRICGRDITDLASHAKTCRNTNCRKQDYRERKKLEKLAAAPPRPQHTKCRECDRLWRSDLDPTEHRCPCGGMIELGDGDRVVNHKLIRHVELQQPRKIPPDPFKGLPKGLCDCLYGNRGLQGSPSPPDDVKSDAQNDPAAGNNVVSIWSLRLPRDLPDYTVAGLLGLPMPAEIAVAA
jgi:hypothetical protein